MAGDNSFQKLGREGMERTGAMGWREGLEPGGVKLLLFEGVNRFGRVYMTP